MAFRLLALSLAIAWPARAAGPVTLPFSDGFEGNGVPFAPWSSSQVNGANLIEVAAGQGFEGPNACHVRYAGNSADDVADVRADFTAAQTRLYTRFAFFLASADGFAPGEHLRVVRLGDAQAAPGSAVLLMRLTMAPDGGMFLGFSYFDPVSGTLKPQGSGQVSALETGAWHRGGMAWEPDLGRARLFLDGFEVPRVDLQGPLPTHPLWRFSFGLAAEVSASGTPIDLYFDSVEISASEPAWLGALGGSDGGAPDGGASDGGARDGGPTSAGPRGLRVGCGCHQAPGVAGLLALVLLAARRRRATSSSSSPASASSQAWASWLA